MPELWSRVDVILKDQTKYLRISVAGNNYKGFVPRRCCPQLPAVEQARGSYGEKIKSQEDQLQRES